jgi:RNA polymerase sigma factor (sigma-70 family)
MTREQFTGEIAGQQESLRRFLLALCGGDAFTADDIAQDACLKAWVAADSFRGASKFSTWLFRIAYNCWCDRRHGACDGAADLQEAETVADGSLPDDAFRYQALYRAIAALKPKEKAAILLFYMEDRSIREIAGIMGVREGTVKSLLSRGRDALKTKLK